MKFQGKKLYQRENLIQNLIQIDLFSLVQFVFQYKRYLAFNCQSMTDQINLRFDKYFDTLKVY